VQYRLLLFLCLPFLLPAEEHWIALKSGPFQVFSSAGDRSAREKLMYLEQFRETLRVITGKPEMRLVWPVHVLVFKNAKEIPPASTSFALGRDARMDAVTESGGFSRESLKELARILLYENTSRLPDFVETGLIELLSTLAVDGTHVTLGAPVPEAERSRGWALMHLVSVNPDYAGRTRVMISNLEQSGDFEAACHNAFEKTAAQINQQADTYLKAGTFGTASVPGRALSAVRDFKPVQLEPGDAKNALADLSLAGASTREASRLLQGAVEPASQSPHAWLVWGLRESDLTKARVDLRKAGDLNPLWAEPHFRLAELEKDNPEQRAALLKKATALEPRNIDYWQALAKTEIAAKNYAEAQKAWGGAERAAANDEERERIHQVRLDVERERADYEAAELKRIAAEREQDIQRVKTQSQDAIHAAEEAARQRMNPGGAAAPKPQALYESPEAGARVQGILERLDCLGQQARLVIQTSDGKTVQILTSDPSQITVGGGEQTLACGPQKPGRQVLVHYTAKPDPKLHTAGVATSIEFH
jgi:tetratricopeptide (TPR) repeat protein